MHSSPTIDPTSILKNDSGNVWFPPFHCRSSVAVSPIPLTVAAAVRLGSSASTTGWPAMERNNGKIELDPTSMEEQLRQLFAVYGCNGTEFSYVIFTEQRNITTAERQRKIGNRMVETGHKTSPKISSTSMGKPHTIIITFPSPVFQ